MPVLEAAHGRMPADERRAQLIDVALDVFSRQGFRGATTKEIAAQAGVTEAMIFRHFPSKEALYTAVLDSRLGSVERQRWHEELDALMERGDDEALFRAILHRVYERYVHDSRFQRVVLFAALEGHELGLRQLGERGDPYLRKVMSYIARRQKAKALIAGEPGRLLLAINGMAHFYWTITRIFQMPLPPVSDEDAVDFFTRVAMHGVSRGEAASPRKKAKK